MSGVGALALVGTLAAPATSAVAAYATGLPGTLDTNFNGSGSLLQGGSSTYPTTTAQGVAIVPTFLTSAGVRTGTSGNIVVAGYNASSTASTLYEYLPSGALAFSAAQIANFDATSVAVVPNNPSAPLADAGDIIVAGWTNTGTSSCTNVSHHAAAIEVFSANLTPLGSGLVAVDCPQSGGDSSQFNAVTVDVSGRPIAAGMATDANTGHIAATLLARFTTGGVLDTTFGGGSTGYEENNVIASTSEANAVTVQRVSGSDRIFVTGFGAFGSGCGTTSPFAAGFDATGTPIATFGPGFGTSSAPGMVYVCGYTGMGNGVAVVSNSGGSDNGDVVIAGQVIVNNVQKNAMFEWDANGTAVNGFGNSSGQVVNSPGNLGAVSNWKDLAYESAGDFLLAVGYAGSNRQMVVSEFSARTGALNPNFGTSGSTVKSFGNQSGFLNSVAMSADGSVVAVGAAPTVGNVTQAYVTELFGPLLTLSNNAATYSTNGSSQLVSFTVSLQNALATAASTVFCYTRSGYGVATSTSCFGVTISAGALNQTISFSVPTAAVGNAVTVNANTVNVAGVGAIPNSSLAGTSVEHYAAKPYDGYWMVTANGAVYNFNTTYYGGANPYPVAPIVGIATSAGGAGYWVVASNGRVYPYGGAAHVGPSSPVSNIVGISATPSGNGFYLVTNRGAILAYGDASYKGGANTLNPVPAIIGIVADPGGRGYWEYSANGAVYTFGTGVPFVGAASQYHPAVPIVGMAAYPGAAGYWEVTSSGGVYSFGAAKFWGAATPYRPNHPIVGMASNPSGSGYWLAESNGGLFTFGHANFHGSLGGGLQPAHPVVGIAG